MTNEPILKTCKVHGELTAELVIKNTRAKDGVRSFWYKCRYCQRISDNNYWQRNREKKILQKREYNERNKERLLIQGREYTKRSVDALDDRYVANKIRGQTNISSAEIKEYPHLIEVKRVSLLIKRRIKEENEHKKYRRLEESRSGNASKA